MAPPRGRKQNITGSGSFHKEGQGVGGGPVGNGSKPKQTRGPEVNKDINFSPDNDSDSHGYSGNRSIGGTSGGLFLGLLSALLFGRKRQGNSSAKRGFSLGRIIRIAIIIIVIIALFRACTSLTYKASSVSNENYETVTIPTQEVAVQTQSPVENSYAEPVASQEGYTTPSGNYYDIGSLLGYGVNNGSSSTGWTYGDNRKSINTSVVNGSREKYYTPENGDKVNILIYMTGTDLESQSGMATSDLQEMCQAELGDDVNLIIYGGGCNKWHNNAFSSSTNKCYQLKSGGQLTLLYDDGDKVMTDPDTLSSFISKVGKAYDAENSRNILIFWDHGGGSLTGYGYDERHSSSSSMDLEGIYQALNKGGVKFDFIGFDACLMATTETALVCSDFADYLIASEESEPGIGWYYTNWLTMLSNNTAVSTLELGKQIADDFVNVCAQQCQGQSATLSVVDLAEASTTIPQYLSDFSVSTTDLIESDNYKTVANARANSKEYAEGNGIDQVDFVSLAANIGTTEGKNLANALLSAVKYNNTSNDMANSYGLSIYFPYASTKYVTTAVQTYSGIKLGDEYSKCIQTFAQYAGAGQSSSYGWGSLGGYSSSSYGYGYGSPYSGYSSSYSYEDIYSMLESMLGSGYMGKSNVDVDRISRYVESNHVDNADLVFSDGILKLDNEQWSNITEVMLSCYYRTDDGYYVDLGIDYNDSCITANGDLIGTFDGAWTAIDGVPVAYYHMNTFDDGTDNWQITGYVPCLINGQRARLILVFDAENEYGHIVGATYDYQGETGTFAKAVNESVSGTYNFDIGDGKTSDETVKLKALNDGDKVEFLADYYDADGNYDDTYVINTITVEGEPEISYVYVVDSGTAEACYRITDIYGAVHWTEFLENE